MYARGVPAPPSHDYDGPSSSPELCTGVVVPAQGLPVSPLCDRNDADLSRSQRGFIDFVCRPCFGPFGKFCGVDMWSEMLRLNKAYWRSQAQDATAMSSRSLRSNMSSRPERDASPARTGPAPRRSSAARRVVPPSAMARFEADTPDTDSKQGDSSDFSGSVRQFGGSVTSSVPGTSRRGTRKSARGLTLQVCTRNTLPWSRAHARAYLPSPHARCRRTTTMTTVTWTTRTCSQQATGGDRLAR